MKESKGLQKINGPGPIRIPSIQYFDQDILVLDYVYHGEKKRGSSFNLGKGVANLHSNKGTHFGFEYDNYIGKNVQKNTPKLEFSNFSWAEFFYKYRIQFQSDLYFSRGNFGEELRDRLVGLEGK